jgi:hypothetical protein
MNCDQIEDKWEQLKGRAKATCGRLTRDWGRVATVEKERLVGTARDPNRVASGWAVRDIGRQPQGTVVPRTSAVPSPFRELAWLGLGAGLTYYLDPDRGRRRRALVRDQVIHGFHRLDDAIGVTVRDFGNRLEGLRGVVARLPRSFGGEEVPDRVLEQRVRSALGRVVSHPHAIGVSAHEGRVVLRGPILADEVDHLLSTVASIPGVRCLERHLDVHREPGDISGLQGGIRRTGPQPEFLQAHWSPTARLLAGTLGTGLVFCGARRGGLSGLALGVVGAALLARGMTDTSLAGWMGSVADGIETEPRSRRGQARAGDTPRATWLAPFPAETPYRPAPRTPSPAVASIEAVPGGMTRDVTASEQELATGSPGRGQEASPGVGHWRK